jgi:hypothetical protein
MRRPDHLLQVAIGLLLGAVLASIICYSIDGENKAKATLQQRVTDLELREAARSNDLVRIQAKWLDIAKTEAERRGDLEARVDALERDLRPRPVPGLRRGPLGICPQE